MSDSDARWRPSEFNAIEGVEVVNECRLCVGPDVGPEVERRGQTSVAWRRGGLRETWDPDGGFIRDLTADESTTSHC